MDLKSLWRSRADTIIYTASTGETDYREVANLAAQIGADYHGRFLIELIQNAEDQAIDRGLVGSTVTIVRTDRHIAVTNQGAPFTEKGLREITSMGLSSKDPTISIGNKGVGFKAVFQVSHEPEIYSASCPGSSFCDENATMFRLAKDPFVHPVLLNALREHVESIFQEQPTIGDRLKEKYGTVNLLDTVLGEIKAAAPFKFPLPLEQVDLDLRLAELDLPPEVLLSAQTLVVLPVLADERTQKVVDKALDELRAKAGSVLLFLSGVGRIDIIDKRNGHTVEIVREPIGKKENVPSRLVLERMKTHVKHMDKTGSTNSL